MAQEARAAVAMDLTGSFLRYAQDDLHRHLVNGSRQGMRVLFGDGAREAEVVVTDSGLYDVHFSTIQLDGDPPGEDRRAKYASDDDLMDALTAWALNRR